MFSETITETNSEYKRKLKKKESFYSYNDELKSIIGRILEDYPIRIGPVMALDSQGICKFQHGDFWNSAPEVDSPLIDEEWQDIASGSLGFHGGYYSISSRLILLPDYWNGVIVKFILSSRDNRHFLVELFVPDIIHNRMVTLPLHIRLQVEVDLLTDDKYVSDIYQFTVTNIGSVATASSGRLLIPLKYVNRSKFPDIHLKFIQ